MANTNDDALRDRLGKLRRKANQQVTAHSWLRDRWARLRGILNTVSLVGGVFLLAFIMATPEHVERTLRIPADYYSWVLALLAASNFSIVVVLLAWRPDERASRHDEAVRHYTRTIYDCSRLLKAVEELDEDTVKVFEDEYLDDRDLPRIPERWFLRLKKWHLEKVAASKALDDDTDATLPRPP